MHQNHKEKLWRNPKPPRKVSSLIIKARKCRILKCKLSLKEKKIQHIIKFAYDPIAMYPIFLLKNSHSQI
jgi:hypothetical protein